MDETEVILPYSRHYIYRIVAGTEHFFLIKGFTALNGTALLSFEVTLVLGMRKTGPSL